MAPWWQQYPVTQGFGANGERGADWGTPQDTPIPVPFGGTVLAAGAKPWGGEVDIATRLPDGRQVIESVLHLDRIAVTPGQVVPAGGVIGLSGGQTAGGTINTDPRYTTGPHTELDLWTGAPWSSPSLDPVPVLAAGTADPGTVQPLNWGPGGILPGNPPPTPGDLLGGLLGGSAGGVGAAITGALVAAGAGATTQAGHGLADASYALALDGATFVKRQLVALAVAAVVLVILFSNQ